MATKQHQKKVVRWASDASEKSWMVRVSALHKQAQKRTDSYSTIFSTSLDLPFEEGWGWVGWDKTNTFLSPVFISALMCRKMKNVNVCFAFTASKRDIFYHKWSITSYKIWLRYYHCHLPPVTKQFPLKSLSCGQIHSSGLLPLSHMALTNNPIPK